MLKGIMKCLWKHFENLYNTLAAQNFQFEPTSSTVLYSQIFEDIIILF